MDVDFLLTNARRNMKGLNLQNFRTFQFLAQFLIFSKYGEETPVFKQFLIATQFVKFYLKTTEYFRSYRNQVNPTNILLQKNEPLLDKQKQKPSISGKSKYESIKEILENIKSGKWMKNDCQPEMFEQFPSGKKIQLITSQQIPAQFSRKRLTFWQMLGEFLLMLRPLAAIIAIRVYGQDSYIPYCISLIVELYAIWLQRKATLLNPVEAMEWKSRQSDMIWRVLFKRPMFKIFTEKVIKKILGACMAQHRWVYRIIMYLIEINSSITLTI